MTPTDPPHDPELHKLALDAFLFTCWDDFDVVAHAACAAEQLLGHGDSVLSQRAARHVNLPVTDRFLLAAARRIARWRLCAAYHHQTSTPRSGGGVADQTTEAGATLRDLGQRAPASAGEVMQ